MINLDPEEKEILEAYEKGALVRVPNVEQELRHHREVAAATFRKDQRLTIRISGRDLDALRRRAMIEGLPYQTFVASILHKYVSGRLIEKPYEDHPDPEH